MPELRVDERSPSLVATLAARLTTCSSVDLTVTVATRSHGDAEVTEPAVRRPLAGVKGATKPRIQVTAAFSSHLYAWLRRTPTALRAAPPDPRPSLWMRC